MMAVICHLVLLMSWSYRQCVLLRCDQVCFGGAAMLKINKLKGVVNCQNSRNKGPPEGNSARG